MRVSGTVLRATAGYFDVRTANGMVRCRMRGRLKKVKQKTDLCVIGDEVLITVAPDDETVGSLEEVSERRNRFSRRHPGRGGQYREDVLVANLDRLFIVFAFGQPRFHPRMLDRFLVIAEHADIDVHVVANKVDQEDPETRALFAEYEELGYAVTYASARDDIGISVLRDALGSGISALAGPSGAGKSSLINAIEPGLRLAVGETSESHGKGRHTTRVSTLHPIAGHGLLADTPGIRELGTFALPDEELDGCFVEFRPFLRSCGFRSCRHDSEPRCAVTEAVRAGEISGPRYESYLRLLRGEER